MRKKGVCNQWNNDENKRIDDNKPKVLENETETQQNRDKLKVNKKGFSFFYL